MTMPAHAPLRATAPLTVLKRQVEKRQNRYTRALRELRVAWNVVAATGSIMAGGSVGAGLHPAIIAMAIVLTVVAWGLALTARQRLQ